MLSFNKNRNKCKNRLKYYIFSSIRINTKENCVCKQYDLIWGAKVSCEFRKKVVDICKSLWGESRKIEMANGLMAVMAVETGECFKAHKIEGVKLKAVNQLRKNDFLRNEDEKTSRAVGLIQFTQAALEGMGEFPKATSANKGTLPRYNSLNNLKLSYAKMGEIAQLDKVKKYLTPNKNAIKSPEDIYLAVFAPKGIGQKDDFVLYTKGTDDYEKNKSVDTKSKGKNADDGKIQRSEILERYYNSYKNGKSNKASAFSCGIIPAKKEGTKNNINLYKIKIDKFFYDKIQENINSDEYQYDVYNNDILLKSILLKKNSYGFLPFPETGVNWGRFGSRDKGGDNWIQEKVCAALLGFFYSLPKNGFKDNLYFNDINANDGRNIGHKGHRNGNDVDIRYPGSRNTAGSVQWKEAKKKYKNEEEFIKVLESILYIATKWGFNKNYAYKTGIKHTTGAATSVHQDHFHIGLR